MIRLYWKAAWMALWTIVTAGLALELPTLAAIDGATTAATASDTRTTTITGEFSTASLLPSPAKDEIDEGLPQLRMNGWSSVIEAYRDGSVTTLRSTPTTTEMILTTGGNGDSSSYASSDGYQHESLIEVNFGGRPTALAGALSERSFTSTESPSKPSKPSSSSGAASPAVPPQRGINIDPPATLFGISPPARIYVPASEEFIASSYGSSSTKKSLITDPVEDGNYALTEDSARVTDATSSSSGARAVETIENYGTVLARNNDAQGSRPGGYGRPAEANLSSAAPSSSTINEFIEAEPPSSSSSFTAKSSTEHSQEDENMKNTELGSGGRANVGRTTVHASSAAEVGRSNEARKLKEATSQDGSLSEIPLIMVTASTKREEEAEREEPMVPDGEGKEEAGVSPYVCISTSCHGTRKGLRKAKKTALDGTWAWERKAEESRALSTPLFRLITKGQLPAKRERRLSFNASSTSSISTGNSSSSTSSSGSTGTAISTAITSTSRESPASLPSLSEYSEGGTTPDAPESPVTIFQMGITASRRSDIGFSSPTATTTTTTTTNPALRRFLESGGGLSIAHSHNQLTRQQQQQQQQQQLRRGHNDNGNSTKVIAPVDQWPVKHSAVVEGDLVLGGLMMVHEREDTVTCGPVMPQGGIQALEAMLYTLDRLNEREIVPGVKVGAHILDDCDKDTYGLEMAVDFIKGSISNIDGAEYHCNKTAVRKVISGVVGAASSVTSIQVANLLRLFRIPQVSFFSTSPELSNKQRFEYFTRTIPSDHYQVKAMVEIIKQMNWTYVSVVYEESNYGVKAFEELESLLARNGICIAVKEKLVKDSGVADESVYDSIVQRLLTKRRARGCIIYGSDQEVAGLMKAVRRSNATGAFSWIGSDGWSARDLVSDGNEAEVEGTLSVQPQANPVEGFEDYFLNLTVENNKRNPWFVEFWEDHFKCRYPNSSLTPYNSKYENFCTTKERLNKSDMAFENQLQFVSDAVMAFGYAFRDMHNDLCHGKVGLCDEMKPTKGEELLKYLRKVDFKGLSGDKFKFDNNGDGPARYNIIHFKQTSPGQYKWIRVGQYLEGTLQINMTEVQFRLEHALPPESVCSLPCELGQAKKYVEGESCCWHCFNCTQYQIRKPDDETQCIDCPEGTVPDDTHSYCRDIPEEFLKLESGWAIGAMSLSSTGILVTLFVVGVFLKHNDTPVVRASGRELSYVLLLGILLCYLVTFVLVLRPTDIVCGTQRFAAGFCFTVVYAALLTKTNRISRIFRAGKHSAKRPSFISPRSQLIICSMLVFVQILINGVWMVIDPARAMHHYPSREDNLLVCNSYIDASYMIAFTYPIILIIICTVYAVLTRKIPEAFNESKHIGFTMYTTCVIWLAFVPLYFGTGNHVALRITSMSVTISLSASVTIACLFSPKLYIILIRPERNVRQSMMPNRHSTTKSSAVTGTNASSMMAPITLTAVTCDQNKTVQKHVTTKMDCSTQSEYYEMTTVRESQNGKPKAPLVSTATQTQNNNNKADAKEPVSGINETSTMPTEGESVAPSKLMNISKIGNGPSSQNDVSL